MFIMKIKKMMSLLLAVSCLSAGSSLLTANAAVIDPDNAAVSVVDDKAEASASGAIEDLMRQLNILQDCAMSQDTRIKKLEDSIGKKKIYNELVEGSSQIRKLLDNADSELHILQNMTYELMDRLNESESKNVTYLNEIDTLNSKLTAANNSLSEKDEEIAKLEASIESYKKQVSDLNSKLTAAQKVNSEYEETFNSILRFDISGNNVLDAADASLILSVYAYNSTHSEQLKTVADLKAKGFIGK